MEAPKIAIFDLTGCEGCQFHLLSLDELLMDFFQDFEITNWRLMSEKDKTDFDIAIIEGAVTTKEDIELLKKIRETSKIVVAIGACAICGNVFVQLSPEQRKKLAPKIYDKDYKLKAEFLEPVEKFIKVDEKIHGCPPDIEAFKKLLESFKKEKISSKIKEVQQPDYTAKIEGHGVLKINFSRKQVAFDVEESERLVEGLLLGKPYQQAPFITSRICGICPVAHNLCSWLAIEDALKIDFSEETIILRKILLSAQIIKSHLLHLFFLVLPDYAGVESATELAKIYPAEFHLMLNIKRAADQALKIVGGSTAFPTNTIFGGFKKPPSYSQLLSLCGFISEVLDEAEDLIKLFAGLEIPQLRVDIKLIHIFPDDNSYPFYPGKLTSLIKEIIKKGSTAKLGVLANGVIVKGGALARINFNSDKLSPKTKEVFDETTFALNNPFNNNLAQAIEISHFLEEITILVDRLKNRDLQKAKGFEKPNISRQVFVGKGSLEAPRGTLIHQIELNPAGKIVDYNIIPPTQINLASLEKEAQILIGMLSDKPKKEQTKLVEKLIRAFDPCITCAVH